eukprot:GHUV01024244.1.p1 GENE.GHUV01024244.1~~GHUV01024244.1.p1  ORF type:complete len:153 (-),score=13.75 GHUV01024244.1:61-519(-)
MTARLVVSGTVVSNVHISIAYARHSISVVTGWHCSGLDAQQAAFRCWLHNRALQQVLTVLRDNAIRILMMGPTVLWALFFRGSFQLHFSNWALSWGGQLHSAQLLYVEASFMTSGFVLGVWCILSLVSTLIVSSTLQGLGQKYRCLAIYIYI